MYDDRCDPNNLFTLLYFDRVYNHVILTVTKSVPYDFKKYVKNWLIRRLSHDNVTITCDSKRNESYNYVRLAYATSKTITYYGLNITLLSLDLYIERLSTDRIPNDSYFYDQCVGLYMYFFRELNRCSFDHLNSLLRRRYLYLINSSHGYGDSMFINLNCWEFTSEYYSLNTNEFGLFVKFKYDIVTKKITLIGLIYDSISYGRNIVAYRSLDGDDIFSNDIVCMKVPLFVPIFRHVRYLLHNIGYYTGRTTDTLLFLIELWNVINDTYFGYVSEYESNIHLLLPEMSDVVRCNKKSSILFIASKLNEWRTNILNYPYYSHMFPELNIIDSFITVKRALILSLSNKNISINTKNCMIKFIKPYTIRSDISSQVDVR